MKKKLLLLAAVAMSSLSSFALEEGEFVYTPQGRFQITSSTNEFVGTIGSSFDGFSVVSVEGKTIADLFTAAEDDVVGTYFQTIETAANTDGIAYKMALGAGETYVVSFKAKSSSVMGIHDVACDHMNVNPVGMNKIAIFSTAMGEGASGTAVDNYSKDNMITTEWTTFCYAISDVDASKDYYIEFLGLNSGVEIADIQINKAFQVMDKRKQDYYVKLVDAYLGLKEWNADEEGETGLEENLETLKSFDENTSTTDLNETINSLLEGINTIVTKKYLDNWLGTEVSNTFGSQSIGNRSTNVGIWTLSPSGRAHSSGYFDGKTYVETPHYAATTAWDRKASAITRDYQDLPSGKYIFSIELTGAVRKSLSKVGSNACWDLDNALDLFQAKLYLINEAGDTIAKTAEYPISASEFTPNFMTFELTEGGNYKVGIDVSGRPELEYTGNYGGTVAFKDAQLLYKSNIAYTKTELDYIAAVKKEITKGRDNITAAQAGLINDNTPWGHADLQACLDSTVTKIETYEAYDTLQIVNTIRDNDGNWVDSETNAEGLLQNEIYLAAVRDLVAANNRFNLVNDSLNLLTNAIAVAKDLSTERTYAASTEGEQLLQAITTANETLVTLRASEYSDANRQIIEEAIAALENAKTTYMNAIPAEAIETLIDIDFSGEVAYEEGADYETSPYSVTISGNKGTMEIGSFMTATPPNDKKGSTGEYTMCSTIPYELGLNDNGEKVLGDVLRVGASSAVVTFDAGDYGSNILKVSMDWWFLRLSGSYVGFKLQDEENNDVTGLVFDTNTSDVFNYNPMNISGWNIGTSFAANTSDNAGAYTDGNKTHVIMYVDYGTKKVKLTSKTQGGSYDSGWTDFNGNEVKAFTVTATTNSFNGRRSWFDNLKIEKITAAEVVSVVGDANGDGQVTMADANAIVNYFLAEDKTTITNFDVTAADVNGDGEISMSDANAAVNIFLGVTVE